MSKEEILTKHLNKWYTMTDRSNQYSMKMAMQEYADKEIASLRQELENKNETIQRMAARMQEIDKEYQQKISGLERDGGKLTNIITESLGKIEHYKSQLQSLEQRIKELENACSVTHDLILENAEHKDTIQSLESKLKEYEDGIKEAYNGLKLLDENKIIPKSIFQGFDSLINKLQSLLTKQTKQ